MTNWSISDRLNTEAGLFIIDQTEVTTVEETRLGAVERRFAELIWRHAPLTSGELVKLCQEELSWKKSTTYTVLKKLCGRGLFRNENGIVQAAVSREAFCFWPPLPAGRSCRRRRSSSCSG